MHPTPRAGPVAGLPIESLLERAEEIARRWAIAMVVARPLAGLGEVPLEDLAREAPELCAQAVRALGSDDELDRLTGRGAAGGREESAPARRLAAISGAGDPSATVEAAEAMRGALWETLLEELRWPGLEQLNPRRLADVSDRLAFVCASALAAALAQAEGSADAGAPQPPPSRRPEAPGPRPPRGGARRAVIVDERDDAGEPAPPREAEIEIRDERSEAGPAAWIGSIGRQLERFGADARPFAVLLVELRDRDRRWREGHRDDLAGLADDLEQVLTAELSTSAATAGPVDGREPDGRRGSGSLTRERPGRYWLLAPGTDRAGARALAERLSAAVRRLATRRGASVEVDVGTAVCPEDGRQPAALAAHADVELYAARSSAGAAAGGPAAPLDQ